MGDDFRKRMARMSSYLFPIEMLQTTVSRGMEKYHDEHDFRFEDGRVTAIFVFCSRFKRVFYHYGIKKIAELKIGKAESFVI